VRDVVRRPGAVFQTRFALLEEVWQPLGDRLTGGAEAARRLMDPVLAGDKDRVIPQVKVETCATNQLVIGTA